MSHQWSPITDLPSDLASLALPELKNIVGIWKERAARLRQTNAAQSFTAQFARERSFESGFIECTSQIELGVATFLIESHIEARLIPHGAADRPPEQCEAIGRDHQAARDDLMALLRPHCELSQSYLCELHAQMVKHQSFTVIRNMSGQLMEVGLVKGCFRNEPNHSTIRGGGFHEYCPPEHIASEVDNLIAWHKSHAQRSIPVEIEAAWLLHRFAQIHPFQDGNGRVARILASLVLVHEGYFPLLITRAMRDDYLEALRIADNGDLKAMISLVARIQRDSLTTALRLSKDMIQPGRSSLDNELPTGHRASY
jgi:fido (protein-threonine AMPylation protein)